MKCFSNFFSAHGAREWMLMDLVIHYLLATFGTRFSLIQSNISTYTVPNGLVNVRKSTNDFCDSPFVSFTTIKLVILMMMMMTFVVFSHMSQQLWDRLPWNLIQIFTSSPGWTLKSLISLWIFIFHYNVIIMSEVFFNTLILCLWPNTSKLIKIITLSCTLCLGLISKY